MKKRNLLIIVLLIFAGLPQVFASGGLSIDIVAGTLDSIDFRKKSVTFNGRVYKYELDKENSLYSYSEHNILPLELKELKVGKRYFFETVTSKKDAKKSDFKTVRFIAIQPLETEDEFNKDEK